MTRATITYQQALTASADAVGWAEAKGMEAETSAAGRRWDLVAHLADSIALRARLDTFGDGSSRENSRDRGYWIANVRAALIEHLRDRPELAAELIEVHDRLVAAAAPTVEVRS